MKTGNASDQLDSFSLLRLRKAALLAHWLPGLSVHVHQCGRRIVRCSTEPADPSLANSGEPGFVLDLHPCQFRRMVLALADARTIGLQPLDPTSHLEIELLTHDNTQLGPHGLVRAGIDDETSVLGFACAIDVEVARNLAQSHHVAVTGDPLDIHFDHDDELGVTLVHRAFETGSSLQERRVFDVLLDLVSVYGAEEVTTHALTARLG